MGSSQFLLRSSITAAFAGFLFGFDTVVISGAEQTIQALWGLSDIEHGLAVSMALWGTVLGSLVGGWPTDHWGRTKTLLWIGVLYFVSAVWSGLATDYYSFLLARFIGGVGVGVSTVAAPLYISEISPPQLRGRLAGMFQFNIVFGIVIAFLSNALLKEVGDNAWRWMLGVEAIPSLLYTLLVIGIPESPRWLIAKRHDHEQAALVLHRINPDTSGPEIDAAVNQIADASSEEDRAAHTFFSTRLKRPILLAFAIAFFNQLSGINAVLYFAPRIFGLTGLDAQAALLQSIGIGLTNLVFTFVGLYLIDRLGRKTLLYIGSFGYILSLGVVGLTFLAYAPQFKVASDAITVKEIAARLVTANRDKLSESQLAELANDLDEAKENLAASSAVEDFSGDTVTIATSASMEQINKQSTQAIEQAAELSGPGGFIVLVGIFAFIAAHAVGQGAVIWVFISEIFPNQHRAEGQALGSFTHWIFAASLTLLFPKMVTLFAPGYVFLFFCGMMVLQLIWVAIAVPETKGVPLEQMHGRLGIS